MGALAQPFLFLHGGVQDHYLKRKANRTSLLESQNIITTAKKEANISGRVIFLSLFSDWMSAQGLQRVCSAHMTKSKAFTVLLDCSSHRFPGLKRGNQTRLDHGGYKR